MSAIPPGMLDWGPGEAAAVNEFLNSPVGKKWLAVLFNRKPQFDRSVGMEKAALNGAFTAGYEQFFAEIAATRISRITEDFGVKPIDTVKD